MEIDWSKAPEGTTHFRPAQTPIERDLWVRFEKGLVRRIGYPERGWTTEYEGPFDQPGTNFSCAIPRPKDSTMPPMPEGATHFCPAFGKYATRAYKQGADAWYLWTGFDWFELKFGPTLSVLGHCIDVRSPRQKAVAEMMAAAECDTPWDEFGRLYDAGYRLFEIVEDDVCPD